jgi:UTP:GlnB (protein PII) uridylyltransferase
VNGTTENPFRTVDRLAQACRCSWPSYAVVAAETVKSEAALREALSDGAPLERFLDPDSALVMFGSFARYEMVKGSDYDWALLIDGVVNAQHAEQARKIGACLKAANLSLDYVGF